MYHELCTMYSHHSTYHVLRNMFAMEYYVRIMHILCMEYVISSFM